MTKVRELTLEEEKVLDYMRDNNVAESGYECGYFGVDKELRTVVFYNKHSAVGCAKALSCPIVGVVITDESDIL